MGVSIRGSKAGHDDTKGSLIIRGIVFAQRNQKG